MCVEAEPIPTRFLTLHEWNKQNIHQLLSLSVRVHLPCVLDAEWVNWRHPNVIFFFLVLYYYAKLTAKTRLYIID